MLAIVSQDGFLRVFHYDTMELLGLARSYFGGFLCVCWSPDAKYIVVGGEDDLVTVWSLHERRVVARGQGHRSWVSVVAFDPFTSYSHCDSPDFSDDEIAATSNDISYNGKLTSNNSAHSDIHCKNVGAENSSANIRRITRNSCRSSLAPSKLGTSYRLGSVGQDTQLCLWDITEDILRQSYEKRHRLGSHDPQQHDDSKPAKLMSSKSIAGNKSETDSNYKCSKISSNAIHGNDIGAGVSAAAHCSNSESNKNSNSSNKFSGKTNVMENCVDTIIGNSNSMNNDSVATNIQSDVSANSKSSSGKSSNESGMTALNTITQRLSSFSFINERKSSSSGGSGVGAGGTHTHSHKKTFTFSKSSGNNSSLLCNSGNNPANSSDLNGSAASLKNAKNVVASYDPMKLIGTNACPRFDECPLLEPLVCKKIAHERLTALIFREDCFLTACQDGFIYTWARPGFSVCTYPKYN